MKKFFLTLLTAAALFACSTQEAGGSTALDKSSDTTLTQMIKEVLPAFRQYTYNDAVYAKTMDYSLFVPKNYDPSKSYPLLLFISDRSTVGNDPKASLRQGWGALVFATADDQARHESFVLVPQFKAQAVDDDFNHTDEVDIALNLLESVVSEYNIDRNRLYTTGQSMGGMISFHYNITHPHLFAASLCVGSQWDTSKMAPFIGNKLFYIVAGGDRASNGMAGLEKVLTTHGVKIAKGEWSAKLPLDEQNDSVQALLAQQKNINFITFSKGSVLPDGTGSEHMWSFDNAYRLQGVRDWLFKQTLDNRKISFDGDKPVVCANDGDWHGPSITSLMAIEKAIAKNAGITTFDVRKNAGGVLVLSSVNDTAYVESTLHDALALAKGRILIGIKNPADNLDAIKEEVKASDSADRVLFLNTNRTIAGFRTVPRINLDNKNSMQELSGILAQNPELVELRYSKSDRQLDDAMTLIGGKTKVMVSTAEEGHAFNHCDATSKKDADQVWAYLTKKGVAVINTNQVKGLQRWFSGETPKR